LKSFSNAGFLQGSGIHANGPLSLEASSLRAELHTSQHLKFSPYFFLFYFLLLKSR